jgi:uncharacterized protein (TIGR03083 family)
MTMTQDQVWRTVDAQRTALADILDQLSDDEWRTPSLCQGWTVRDVAAHLTLQKFPIPLAITTFVQARGNVKRAIHESSCRRATEPVEQLIARLRGLVGHHRPVPGMTYVEALIDHLVHGQDLTVPLGRRLDVPPGAAATAATGVWTRHEAMFKPQQRFRGFRLVATDVDWSAGEGTEVRAPVLAILLVLTGRGVALPQLTGVGAAALTSRLSASA